MIVNENELIEALRYECFKAKGQKKFANANALKESTLSAVLNGKRPPNDEMIKLAGYELRYVKTVATPQGNEN